MRIKKKYYNIFKFNIEGGGVVSSVWETHSRNEC